MSYLLCPSLVPGHSRRECLVHTARAKFYALVNAHYKFRHIFTRNLNWPCMQALITRLGEFNANACHYCITVTRTKTIWCNSTTTTRHVARWNLTRKRLSSYRLGGTLGSRIVNLKIHETARPACTTFKLFIKILHMELQEVAEL